jgi:hypothetical protein
VTVTKRHDWPFGADFNYFDGETSCTRAIDQSGQVRLEKTSPSEPTSYGPLCSGFVASCSSSGEVATLNDGEAVYSVHLVAPFGQGWLVTNDLCQGSGSDKLTCEFRSNNVAAWST